MVSIVLFCKIMIEKYQLKPVVVFVEGVEIQLLLQLVYAVGPYLDLYGQKARLEIINGANHQFTSVEWKNKVYELSIEYIKEKTGSIEK